MFLPSEFVIHHYSYEFLTRCLLNDVLICLELLLLVCFSVYNENLLLSPATHSLLYFSQFTELLTSLWSFSTNSSGFFALTLSVTSSTKITLSASSWQSGMSLELMIWKTLASTESCGAPLSSQSRRSLVFDSILTHCFLSPRYDWIHSIDASSTFYSFSFFGNKKWSKSLFLLFV